MLTMEINAGYSENHMKPKNTLLVNAELLNVLGLNFIFVGYLMTSFNVSQHSNQLAGKINCGRRRSLSTWKGYLNIHLKDWVKSLNILARRFVNQVQTRFWYFQNKGIVSYLYTNPLNAYFTQSHTAVYKIQCHGKIKEILWATV
jgi:hypothetical protein